MAAGGSTWPDPAAGSSPACSIRRVNNVAFGRHVPVRCPGIGRRGFARLCKPESWLCLPGRTDICTTPLKTTALNPNGYGSTGQSEVSKDAVDCFVVYPTVSRDSGMNSDLKPGEGEEKAVIVGQFARFAGSCRIFAPVYRQMTLGAVAASAAGADVTKPAILAYSDVRSAWKEYLAKYNKGRPYVLLGHSQGSLMLQQLLAHEIEESRKPPG